MELAGFSGHMTTNDDHGHRSSFGCHVAQWQHGYGRCVAVMWIGGGVIFVWQECSCWGLLVSSSGRCGRYWPPSFHFRDREEKG